MDKPKVLLVEDDLTLREILKVGLEYEGFLVHTVAQGAQALREIRASPPDVLILDLMLPDIHGFEVCRKIRQWGLDLPILMLTARREVQDRVKGLNLGADDYLVKPFEFEELLARLRALLRRYKKTEAQILRCGPLLLNKETREVFLHEHPLSLTPTEFRLLALFMQHPRRVFSKEALLRRVWGYEYADPNLVDVHISRLRKKLGDRPPRLIRTHYGAGYAFYPEDEASEP